MERAASCTFVLSFLSLRRGERLRLFLSFLFIACPSFSLGPSVRRRRLLLSLVSLLFVPRFSRFLRSSRVEPISTSNGLSAVILTRKEIKLRIIAIADSSQNVTVSKGSKRAKVAPHREEAVAADEECQN